jgi:peptidoglycan hydrolase-like protein with peptidoglycan-binding domain
MVEFCFTPGQAGSRLDSAFSAIPERLVQRDYCKNKNGCTVFLRPAPAPQTDFFDRVTGFHPCRHMAAFLKMHNPSIDEVAVATACEAKKVHEDDRSLVPDIITHQPPERKEFYEIKALSAQGTADGDQKIANFLELCAGQQIIYLAGEKYDCRLNILVRDATWSGIPVKIFLRIRSTKKALIQYHFCVESNSEFLTEAIAKLLIVAVVAALVVLFSTNPVIVVGAAGAALLLASQTSSPMQGSVGAGGMQDDRDTRYAQRLLNDWRVRNGLGLIGVDGLVGDETIGAIVAFQEVETGAVDGRLDPGGVGIRALERLHIEHGLATTTTAQFELDDDPVPTFDERAVELMRANEPGLTVVDLVAMLGTTTQDYLDAIHAV